MKKPSGHVPAGGAFSSKKKEVSVKAGPPSTEKMSPCAVDQLGNHLGNAQAVEKLKMGTAPQVPSGNAVALNSGQRPGQGRTVSKPGSQGQH